MRPPGEAPRFAWDGRSPPLDVYLPASEPRAEGAVTLPEGGAVLLYTDGLIERRTQSLDDGMERLLAETEAHRGADAAALAGAVVRALHDPEHADDVCLLAARLAA